MLLGLDQKIYPTIRTVIAILTSFMTTLRRIFELREEIDRDRQPTLSTHLTKLIHLVEPVADHPYELPPGSERALYDLAGCEECNHNAAKWPAETEHVYRLHSLPSALRFLEWPEYADELAAGAIDELLTPIFESLSADFEAANDWLRLSSYASGEIANDRAFSWWTTFKEICDDPWFGSHRLGLPDQWIPLRGLLLRCESITAESYARVPTALDGFYSPIFACSVINEDVTPSAGETIDLRGNGPVIRGVPEYALRPLPTTVIDFVPVLVDHRPEPRVPWSHPTWQRVADAYEGMKNGSW